MEHINLIVEDQNELDSSSSDTKKEFSPIKKKNSDKEMKEGSKLEEDCVIDVIEWLSNEELLSELKKWKIENLSRLASNFSKWPDAALSKRVIENIVIIIEEKLSGETKLNNQMLCSFAQLFIDQPNESWSCNLMQKIAAEFFLARYRDEEFTIQQLCKLTTGFSKWPDQECCHKAMIEISVLIQRDLPEADITEEEVGDFAIALFEWSNKDWCKKTMDVIRDAAIKKVMDGKRFTKSRLLKLAIAFGKWSEVTKSFTVVRMIALNNIASFGADLNFTKEELVHFATAFSQYAEYESKTIHEVMRLTSVDFYSKCFKNKEEFTFEQLYNLAIAFDKWPQENWSYMVAFKICKDFDLKSFSDLRLTVQEQCELYKVLEKIPKNIRSQVNKLPFILLAPESHKKPLTFGRFLRNIKQKSLKALI